MIQQADIDLIARRAIDCVDPIERTRRIVCRAGDVLMAEVRNDVPLNLITKTLAFQICESYSVHVERGGKVEPFDIFMRFPSWRAV